VTFEEALGELGVGRDASGEDVRRAYLHLLKKHKPETDPDGFQKLREAYELARRVLGASIRRGEDSPRPQGPTEKEHHPSTASPSPQAEPIADPSPVSPRRPTEAEPPPVPFLRMVEWRRLLADGRIEECAARLEEEYEAAAKSSGVNPPSLVATTEVVLQLLESGHAPRAAALYTVAQRWLETSGEEIRTPSDETRATWKVTGEIARLCGRLSPGFLRVLAALARGTPWDELQSALGVHRAHSPAEARLDAHVIQVSRLPSADAIARVLRGERVDAPDALRKPAPVWILLLVFSLLGSSRALMGSCESTPPPHMPIAEPTRALAPSSGSGGARALAMSLAASVSMEAKREGTEAARAAADAVSGAFERNDCAAAMDAMRDLHQSTTGDTPASARLRENVDDLDGKVAWACAVATDAGEARR
jgi:hypothetical protein